MMEQEWELEGPCEPECHERKIEFMAKSREEWKVEVARWRLEVEREKGSVETRENTWEETQERYEDSMYQEY